MENHASRTNFAQKVKELRIQTRYKQFLLVIVFFQGSSMALYIEQDSAYFLVAGTEEVCCNIYSRNQNFP
ncbi:hypothetical protein TRIUR3_13314 [Triticum urartu]|uniref:Uncharacterized protein n=1 Tax=Triticum urartu TaxID=4572 RepID=M7ZWX6_TRIUA|nr:hypothetical protein TRIUR3_13314 [Triticum urartu]